MSTPADETAVPPGTDEVASPQLRNWLADLRAANDEARVLFELSAEQLLWKPAPASWSVAECVGHLVTTAELYHPRIAAALAAAERVEEPQPFKAGWFKKRFIRTVSPTSKRKLKTFKAFQPSAAAADPVKIEREFFARQDELADLLRRADGLDLNAGRIDSPLTRLLHFTFGEAFWLLTAHARRHLLQAANLRRLCPLGGIQGGERLSEFPQP